MYRLVEIVILNDKESQSINDFATETEALASFHSKYGSQICNPYYNAQMLLVLDGSLRTIEHSYHTQDETLVIKPRLIEVKTTTEEAENMAAYDSNDLVIGNFHTKLGSAMNNANVKIEVLKGIDSEGNEIIYDSWIRTSEG